MALNLAVRQLCADLVHELIGLLEDQHAEFVRTDLSLKGPYTFYTEGSSSPSSRNITPILFVTVTHKSKAV